MWWAWPGQWRESGDTIAVSTEEEARGLERVATEDGGRGRKNRNEPVSCVTSGSGGYFFPTSPNLNWWSTLRRFTKIVNPTSRSTVLVNPNWVDLHLFDKYFCESKLLNSNLVNLNLWQTCSSLGKMKSKKKPYSTCGLCRRPSCPVQFGGKRIRTPRIQGPLSCVGPLQTQSPKATHTDLRR